MNLWRLLKGITQTNALPDDTLVCPACQAHVESPREILVEWDACHTRFAILHRTHCAPCQYTMPVLAKIIPLVITPRAACSCGALLNLTGYTMQQTPDELTYEALYLCSACTRRKRVVASKLKRLLAKRWQTLTHLVVGPTGLQEICADTDEEPSMSVMTSAMLGE